MDSNPTIVFCEPGNVVIEDRAVPVPGENELLIRTENTLISTGTELTILSGKYPEDSHWATYGKLPFLPGYNNVGEVVDVGKNVSTDWLGRRVATYGNHSRYVTVDSSSARPVRIDIPSEEAAFFSISDIVMNGIRRAGIQWGESVVVYGLGLLGQLTVQLCHICGAMPVFGVDVADQRLKRLPQRPGILATNPTRQDMISVVREATNGRMADAVFEVTGDPDLIKKEFDLLRRQGKYVVLSSPRGRTFFDFHDMCNAPSYTIIGAHCDSHPQVGTLDNPWTMQRHSELFFDLLANGELNVSSLISHRGNFQDAPHLYRELLRDRSKAMGIVLEWTNPPAPDDHLRDSGSEAQLCV